MSSDRKFVVLTVDFALSRIDKIFEKKIGEKSFDTRNRQGAQNHVKKGVSHEL